MQATSINFHGWKTVCALSIVLMAVNLVLLRPVHAGSQPNSGTRIPARGAFSCDFITDATQVTAPPGAIISRDRIFSQRYAEEVIPIGTMLQKHIPFLPVSETEAFSGGRYLFSSRYQAAQYEDFIKEKFVYPGETQFLERPEFINPQCEDWGVIKAWRFQPLEEHVAFRTERFDTGLTSLGNELVLNLLLRIKADHIIAEAEQRGYAEVHILHNIESHQVQLVYFQGRLIPSNPDGLALQTISEAEPLGEELVETFHVTRIFDLSEFVFTIWKPYDTGDSGEAALWPNSPPFPEPFCGDGVCIPSRGEDNVSCIVDCTPNCGDGVCDNDETLDFCPSDCEIPFQG